MPLNKENQSSQSFTFMVLQVSVILHVNYNIALKCDIRDATEEFPDIFCMGI